MASLDERMREFNAACGDILRAGVFAETRLDLFIAGYFAGWAEKKAGLLNDLFLAEFLDFEKKNRLFKKICEQEGIPAKDVNEVFNAAESIRRVRNKIAHYEPVIEAPAGKVKLQPRKGTVQPSERVEIDAALVKQVAEKSAAVTQGLVKITQKLRKA
ncbi:MAG: hypothetical protein NTY90_05600 [Candidatus Micrarchaeota archaeon]|nr:hypothetical protein [Candidatus Micrarchaeota archaeon]